MSKIKRPITASSSPIDDALRAALDAQQRAYVPYSKFQVGAAVLTKSGEIFAGANMENASYPLCVCAERHAIAQAVFAGMKPGELQALVVVVQQGTPCGACRQVLAEFGSPDTEIHVHELQLNRTRVYRLDEFLPDAFSGSAL